MLHHQPEHGCGSASGRPAPGGKGRSMGATQGDNQIETHQTDPKSCDQAMGNLLPATYENNIKIQNNLNDISNFIQNIAFNQLNDILHSFDHDKKMPQFTNIELAFRENKIVIVNKILDGIGLALSNANQSRLSRQYKSFYKSLGIKLRTNRRSNIDIITIEGIITIGRYLLRPKTPIDNDKLISLGYNTNIYPMDDFIGITKYPFKITPQAVLEIAYEGCKELSFQAAATSVKKINNVDISYLTIRNVTNMVGQIIYENEMKKANNTIDLYNKNKLSKFRNNKNAVLYIEPDGAMIHLRDRKNINNSILRDNNGKKDELISEKAKIAWYENKLAIVFSSDNMTTKKRKIQLNIGKNDKLTDNYYNDNIEYILTKREYVSYIGSYDIFQKLLFHCAIKNGYGQYKTTILLSDGATWIKTMKSIYFQDAIHILDFYHLAERTFEFAKKYFKEDESKYVPWAKNAIYFFKNSKYKELMTEIKKMQTKIKDKRYNLYDYIVNNRDSIDYKCYKSKGYYIGSGHIESGNKSVFQERLKRPGMMWNRDIAQHLLTLRSKLKSNLWSEDVKIPFLRYCYEPYKSIIKF
jgi:hypothetical protein